MAGEWDVVEDKPVSEWDVVSSAPATPAARPGEIPGTRAPTPTAPRQAPGLLARLNAIGEAVIDQVLGGVGGTVGFLSGGALGMAKDVAGLATEGPSNYRGNEAKRLSGEGAQRGAESLRQSYYGMPFVGQPSKLGQEYSEDAGEFLQQNAPSFMAGPGGIFGLARQAPKGAMGTGLRAVTDAAAGSKAAEAVRAGTTAVADKVLPEISPSNLARVKTANEAGVPVSPHQLSGNKFLKLLGEAAEDVPLAGGETLRRTRREAFSGGLVKAIDPSSTATVLDDATFKNLQDTAGSRIGEIAGRTDVPVEAFGDLSEIARRDTPDVQGVIDSYAKDLAQIAEENGGVVPGGVLRKLRTEAQAQERGARAGKGDLANALDRFTKRLDDALSEHAPEADMEALADARRQYAISKALEPLVSAYPNGDFPPARLKSVITGTKEGKHRMATGRAGELGEYARLGQEVLKEQVTSMTAERSAVYRTAGALGVGGAVAATVNPLAALGVYGGAAAYNLLGPRAVKWLAERQQRRNAPKPERPPPEPTLGAGFEDVPQGQPPAKASPLGDLTPDWETAPGANGPPRAGEEPGLAPALGEALPAEERGIRLVSPIETPELVGPPRGGRALPETVPPRATETEIPAVPGRPDLPDTMVAGGPSEVAGARRPIPIGEIPPGGLPDEWVAGRTEAVADVNAAGTAMQAPEAALARQRQAEALQQRAQVVQSPEVRRVLETQAAKLALEAKRMKDAHDLRMEAATTSDPTIRQALLDHAKRLERAEKVAVGETKEGMPKEKPAKAEKIPVPEATEVPVEEVTPPNPDLVFETGKGWVKRSIPAGEATELPTETVVYDAKGRALEVGRTYTDSKGRRAVWQADGTWKILR